MQQFKIDHYNSEMSDNVFPEYQPLNEEDCAEVIREIKSVVSGVENHENVFIGISKECSSKSITDDELDNLDAVLVALGFDCSGQVCIIWDETEIDIMDMALVAEHWIDIWYPPSDEAVILYCRDTNKLVMVTDWGQVFYN